MGVTTTYDEMRYKLLSDMDDCLEQARELLNTNIYGYDEMKEDYALDLYVAIKRVKDMI